ncbi:NADP-dependent phosphogluconate dehydrogenase [Babesia caballi]|uniref:phosphogluconate dehydrogenase (NADP(+)-dependent, decarboxylating) n=1 Tax=Babesia caballi TaxID=5871 RepID=A0AAV4M2K8_BABCB|nr:NADP-dependent phosphogluconate dehydrogenase [Babesia caballi]
MRRSYCALGISGGEKGARLSPCLMFSGPYGDYEAVRPFIEQEEGRSFYVGPGASGHYVKMVHNGIEYGIMQILSEVYMIMRCIFELELDTISKILAEWNESEVGSFLLGITADILQVKTNDGMAHLLDKIVDTSGANGTGKWTVKEALDLGVPTPTITAAVEMRHASNAFRSTVFMPNKQIKEGHTLSEGDLKRALTGCVVVCFAQGTALLMKASQRFEWGLNIRNICDIWSRPGRRGGRGCAGPDAGVGGNGGCAPLRRVVWEHRRRIRRGSHQRRSGERGGVARALADETQLPVQGGLRAAVSGAPSEGGCGGRSRAHWGYFASVQEAAFLEPAQDAFSTAGADVGAGDSEAGAHAEGDRWDQRGSQFEEPDGSLEIGRSCGRARGG